MQDLLGRSYLFLFQSCGAVVELFLVKDIGQRPQDRDL